MPLSISEKCHLNTYDDSAADIARNYGFGIELDELLLYSLRNEREKQCRIQTMLAKAEGIPKRIVHGTIVGTDPDTIRSTPPEDTRKLFETSYNAAKTIGADKLVFHSDRIPALEKEEEWVERNASFWLDFLQNKDNSITICLENLLDENPELMGRLYDEINDPRLCLCLDTGHAHANSKIGVDRWITILGARIGHVHLHNNDGSADRHWPLGRGTLDMNRVLYLLQEHAPAATMTIEADFLPSLHWLKEHQWI